MKAVGMDTLVFIRGGFEGRTIFPSENFFCLRKDDLVDFILKDAEKRDMKVYIGLYISNLTWNDGDVKKEIEATLAAKKSEQLIMSLMPAGIILYMRLTSPGFLDVLYGNPFGICAMTVCLGIYAGAYWMGRRIVDIEV